MAIITACAIGGAVLTLAYAREDQSVRSAQDVVTVTMLGAGMGMLLGIAVAVFTGHVALSH